MHSVYQLVVQNIRLCCGNGPQWPLENRRRRRSPKYTIVETVIIITTIILMKDQGVKDNY